MNDLILFIKAQHKGASDKMGDLFETMTRIEGSVDKDGHTRKPHWRRVKKKRQELKQAKPTAQMELFGQPAQKPAAPKPEAQPTEQERERLTKVRAFLKDTLETQPDDPRADEWKAKIAKIDAAIGPEKVAAKPEAEKPKPVDQSKWTDPRKAAYALTQEYRERQPLTGKTLGAFKRKVHAAAKKTPKTDEHAVMLLDQLWTKLVGTDYDPKWKELRYGKQRDAQSAVPGDQAGSAEAQPGPTPKGVSPDVGQSEAASAEGTQAQGPDVAVPKPADHAEDQLGHGVVASAGEKEAVAAEKERKRAKAWAEMPIKERIEALRHSGSDMQTNDGRANAKAKRLAAADWSEIPQESKYAASVMMPVGHRAGLFSKRKPPVDTSDPPMTPKPKGLEYDPNARENTFAGIRLSLTRQEAPRGGKAWVLRNKETGIDLEVITYGTPFPGDTKAEKWDQVARSLAANGEEEFRRTVAALEAQTAERARRDGQAEPKPGDTKTENGITYELRDGRWHRVTAEDEPAKQEYRYAAINRPPGFATVPGGYTRVDPRPEKGHEHYDVARHGFVVYDHPLTPEEMKSYELHPVVDGADREAMAKEVADGINNHREKIIQFANAGKLDRIRPSIANVFETLHPERPAVGDFNAFLGHVVEHLKADQPGPVELPAEKPQYTLEEVMDLADAQLGEDETFEVFNYLDQDGLTNGPWPAKDVHRAIRQVRREGMKATAKKAKQALLAANGGEALGVEAKHKDGAKYGAVLPDASEAGKFRNSRWDERGFYTHQTFDTAEAALDDLVADGFTEPAAGALDRMSQTDEWARGMELTAEIQRENERRAAGRQEQPPEPEPDPQPKVIDKLEFGVPEGATKGQRKAWNQAALDLLKSHPEGQPWTPEEKQVLARYSGQGGVGGSLNEFYTREDVAGAAWSLAKSLGFEGSALEMSCGTGVFAKTAPEGAKVTGVELDQTSSQIAKALFDIEVHNTSAEQFARSDGREFDLVIGNPPYGPRGSLIGEDKKHLATAEQYFLDTAIDKANDGGLVIQVVPTGILDSSSAEGFRDRLSRKAVFLGAFRLPNTAFSHSHTGVTTDIVVFRARPKSVAGVLAGLTRDEMASVTDPQAEFVQGGYFRREGGHPDIYGTLEAGWRAKAGMGNDITVSGSMDGVADAIAQRQLDRKDDEVLGLDPAGIIAKVAELNAAQGLAQDAIDRRSDSLRRRADDRPYTDAKIGDIKTVNGVSYRLEGEPPRWHRIDDDAPPEALTAARDLASLLRTVHWRRQDGTLSDDEREAAREAAQAYVDKHGVPSQNADLMTELKLNGDRDLYRVVGAINDDGSLSDLLTGKQAAGEISMESLAQRLSLRQGGFTEAELANELNGTSPVVVRDALLATDEYMHDGKRWMSSQQYLTGNLWERLDRVRELKDHEGLFAAYQNKYAKQEQALLETINPKLLDDVEIEMRSAWVGPELLTEWLEEGRQANNQRAIDKGYQAWDDVPVSISFENGIYTMTGRGFGGDRDLILKYLNRGSLRKEDDKPTIDRLNHEFKQWLLTGDHREDLEERYNRTFLGYVKPEQDDSPLTIPGLNPEFDINAYHYAGLRWAMQAEKGIIAAGVGLGKSGRGLMLGALARAHGRAKKPTYVVPKSVLANWVAETDAWFPGSNILVIGEEYERDENGALKRGKDGNLKAKADSAETKARKLASLAQNNYDFVFISQPAWNAIDLDPIAKGEMLETDFWVQRGKALDQAGDARTRKIREQYNQAVAKREFRDRSAGAYFNDLGIDFLVIDEMHMAKNLFSVKPRWGDSPRFLGGGGQSNRAHDTNLKAKWFLQHNQNRNIYGLTATPTKNSPLEVYSMLHHICPEEFEAIGIRNSEEFIDRFVEFESDQFLSTTGEIDTGLVCAGFKNLDELRPIMERNIDRTTAAQVGLKLPEAKHQTHYVDMSPLQQQLYAELRELAKPSGGGDGEHIFRVIDQMSKASLDPALLSDVHAGAETPKLDKAVENVLSGIKDGGQVVFCDYLGGHDTLKAKLIAAGVDPKRIAIVNAKAAPTAAKREGISDQFNKGKLDVVIGNTATMGEGMNLQKRTADIHHLDMPWEPASIQQRNGRGLRQGNKNESIRIHTYMAKGSFDGYRWQTLMSKGDWQDQIWNGGDRIDNPMRQTGFSREDIAIMMSSDPEAARKALHAETEAAKERRDAAERAKVSLSFQELQLRKRTYAGLKQPDSKTGRALKAAIDKQTDKLRSSAFFPHKEALERGEAGLLEPTTGELWAPDVATTMDGQTWVVDAVDLDKQTVDFRKYGDSGAHRWTKPLDELASQKTVPYSREAEDAHKVNQQRLVSVKEAVKDVSRLLKADADTVASTMDDAFEKATSGVHQWHRQEKSREQVRKALHEAMLSVADAGVSTAAAAQSIYRGYLFAAHGVKGKIDSMETLASLGDETLGVLGDALHHEIRSRMRGYQWERGGQLFAVEQSDGGMELRPSYNASKVTDRDRLVLPTAANRERAITEALHYEASKKLATDYSGHERRGKPRPDRFDYAHHDYSVKSSGRNPIIEALGDAFPGLEEDVKARANAQATRAVEAADSPQALLAAASQFYAPSARRVGNLVPKDAHALIHKKVDELGSVDENWRMRHGGYSRDQALQKLRKLLNLENHERIGSRA